MKKSKINVLFLGSKEYPFGSGIKYDKFKSGGFERYVEELTNFLKYYCNIYIIGDISASGATYYSVEFHGEINHLSIDDRFTIANMGIEMGAKNTVFPVDSITTAYLSDRGIKPNMYTQIDPDPEAP